MSSKHWWTDERRQAQRERIFQVKPWLKSTGAITTEGKAVVSQNAYKGDALKQAMALAKTVEKRMKRIEQRNRQSLEFLGLDYDELLAASRAKREQQ